MVEISLVTGAITIGKQLFELGKKIKDREIKEQLDEIANKVRELKQSASTRRRKSRTPRATTLQE